MKTPYRGFFVLAMVGHFLLAFAIAMLYKKDIPLYIFAIGFLGFALTIGATAGMDFLAVSQYKIIKIMTDGLTKLVEEKHDEENE